MKLAGTRTEKNLKDAFAGESQANRRYLYFAAKADVEGLLTMYRRCFVPLLKARPVTPMGILSISSRWAIRPPVCRSVRPS